MLYNDIKLNRITYVNDAQGNLTHVNVHGVMYDDTFGRSPFHIVISDVATLPPTQAGRDAALPALIRAEVNKEQARLASEHAQKQAADLARQSAEIEVDIATTYPTGSIPLV